MPYCIKCGVKLENSESECPLCQTKVYHPDLVQTDHAIPPFPIEAEHSSNKIRYKYKILIATFIILHPTLLTVICDYSINNRIVWSNIVVAAVLLIYSIIFIPLIFQKKDIFYYLSFDFAALLLFQKYISSVFSGKWFLAFSLPLTCSVMLIIALVLLIKRIKKPSNLFIAALIFLLSGFECILLEFLVNNCFTTNTHLLWSYYPAATFIITGAILLIFDRNKRLNDKIKKTFFI